MSALERLNVSLRGTGDRAMVFAHGFGCDQRMWRHVAPHFETEFVTVLIDHVGSGGSDISAYVAEKYSTLQGYAQDIVELGREVPLDGAVFVGHSCGAMIGLLASIQSPTMFESLILVSASPRYIDDGEYAGGLTKKEVLNILRGLRTDYPAWSESMAPVFMGNASRPELADELLQSFKRTDPEIAAAFGAATFTSDWRKELSRVMADCLVIQSEKDAVVPISVGKYLASRIPRARLEILATDGHFPHLSAPDSVVQRIRQFVSLQPSGRSDGIPKRVPHDGMRWPDGDDPDLLLRAGIWSRRLPPIADAVGRAELEELLFKRAGEFYAHLGRYDMHALTIATWLGGLMPTVLLETPVNVRTRGCQIKKLLAQAPIKPAMYREFEEIVQELQNILDRHDTAAQNCAVIPALVVPRMHGGSKNPKNWYEYDSASDQELLFFIDAIERDILLIAALCLRLSTFAEKLSDLGRPRTDNVVAPF